MKLRELERGRVAGTVAVSGDQDLGCRRRDTDRPPTVTGGMAVCKGIDVAERREDTAHTGH